MTKKPKHAKPVDRTNAQRQRRYINRLKDAAAPEPPTYPTPDTAPIDGRDLHVIAQAMVQITDMLTKLASPPMMATQAQADIELLPAKRWLSGRWKLRDGDHIQRPVNPTRDI